MSDDIRRILYFAMTLLALLLVAIQVDRLLADEQPQAASPDLVAIHGGVQKTTSDGNAEIAFHSDGIGLFLYDKDGKALPLKGAKATAHVEFLDSARAAIDAEMVLSPAGAPGGDARQDQLWGKMDLSKVAEGEATATLRVTGLGADGKKDLAMVAPFRMARVVSFSCEKCGLSTQIAGRCPNCGGPLLMVRSYFGCRKHPTVALDRDGTCWKCGDAKLELIVEPLGPAKGPEPSQGAPYQATPQR